MTTWIVHREPRLRAALARLAAATEDTLRAGPGDPVFDAAPVPDVVLLGLGGDFEAELEFAHHVGPRLRETGWILIPQPRDVEAARRLFDALDAEVLSFPPDARTLRERIRALLQHGGRTPLPLSARPARDALSLRFARWFSDLDLPELMRALDPQLASTPVLIRGEPGTGRTLLGRYLHAFGGTAGGTLAAVGCTPEMTATELCEALAVAAGTRRAREACSVLLEDVDRLGAPLQRELRDWVDFGAPEGVLPTRRLRWIGCAGDEEQGDALDPDLARALGRITVRLPPLRERPQMVPRFANDTALAWCARHGVPTRRVGEDAVVVLEEYPWPGNLRELEAVVEETLAAGAADPVRADDLLLDGIPFAPLGAPVVGRPLAAQETGPARGEEMAVTELLSENELEAEPEPVVIAEKEPESAEPLAPAAEPFAPAAGGAEPAGEANGLRRLAGALAHEVRNPLTAIRSFVDLLPERYGDPDFRVEFARRVKEGALRIEDVVERLEQLAAMGPASAEPVDVTSLLSELLQERRDTIRKRRLLVLKELEAERPTARVDPEQIRLAFHDLLDKALDLVPERGDIYFASKHHPDGLRGGPSLRVLVRFHGPRDAGPSPSGEPERLSPADHALAFAIAETIVRGQKGTLTVDAGEMDETVLVVDLPG